MKSTSTAFQVLGSYLVICDDYEKENKITSISPAKILPLSKSLEDSVSSGVFNSDMLWLVGMQIKAKEKNPKQSESTKENQTN